MTQTRVIGDQSLDNYPNIDGLLAEINAAGTLTEPWVVKYRNAKNLRSSEANVLQFSCVTSVVNNLLFEPFDTNDKTMLADNMPTIKSSKGGSWGVINIENGANHIKFVGLNLHASASNMYHVKDNRTTIPGDSDIDVTECLLTYDSGLVTIGNFAVLTKTGLISNIKFTRTIGHATVNGLVGRKDDLKGIIAEQSLFLKTDGSTSFSGVYATKINNSAVFGFGTAAGYNNLSTLEGTSSHVATNDGSGLNNLINLDINACFENPAQGLFSLKSGSPLKGAASDGGDILGWVVAPTPVTAAFSTAPSIVSGSITDKSVIVTGASATRATARVVVTTASASQPTDAAFQASAFKQDLQAGETFNIVATGLSSNTDYKTWVQLTVLYGTNTVSTAVNFKTARKAPVISSVSNANPKIGEVITITGTGLSAWPEAGSATISGTVQANYAVTNDTTAQLQVTRPVTEPYGKRVQLNIGGTNTALKLNPENGWDWLVVRSIGPNSVLTNPADAVKIGDLAAWDTKGGTITLNDDITLTAATGVTISTEIEIYDGTSWGARGTISEGTPVANSLPTIQPISPVSVEIGKSISIPVVANDADNDTLKLRLKSGHSDWLSISGTNIVAAPVSGATAKQYTETVIADDGKGGATSIDFLVIVTNPVVTPANAPPVITSNNEVLIQVGDAFSYKITATDANNDTLTYSVSTAGYAINGDTVTRAAFTQVGSDTLRVGVSDGNNPTVYQDVTVTISAKVTDTEKPVITKTGGDTAINVGDTYTPPTVTATDNVDQNIAVVKSGDTVNPAVAGTYTERYNYTDAAGNVADEVTHTVVVSSVVVAPSPVRFVIDGDNKIIDLSGQLLNHTYAHWFITTDDVDAKSKSGDAINVLSSGNGLIITNGVGSLECQGPSAGQVCTLVAFTKSEGLAHPVQSVRITLKAQAV